VVFFHLILILKGAHADSCYHKQHGVQGKRRGGGGGGGDLTNRRGGYIKNPKKFSFDKKKPTRARRRDYDTLFVASNTR
jgi:hypothetical protein